MGNPVSTAITPVSATLPLAPSSPAGATKPRAAAPTKGAAAADPATKAAREFEAMVMGQFFEAMFAGLKTTGPFGGGQAEQTWRSFMIQEYGRQLAETGTIGIAQQVHGEIARLYNQSMRSE